MEIQKAPNQTISIRLKQYRIERDLTLETIAQLTGLAAPTIYRIENGLVVPNDRTLHKLQKALPGLMDPAA